jgi:hypothetical protein
VLGVRLSSGLIRHIDPGAGSASVSMGVELRSSMVGTRETVKEVPQPQEVGDREDQALPVPL